MLDFMGHGGRWACRLCRKAEALTSGRGTAGNGLFTKPQETPPQRIATPRRSNFARPGGANATDWGAGPS